MLPRTVLIVDDERDTNDILASLVQARNFQPIQMFTGAHVVDAVRELVRDLADQGRSGADIAEAHRLAHECDPVSAYGGIIATNRPVTLEMAEVVKDIFTEVIVAPGFDGPALDVLTAKKNIRLLVVDPPPGLLD